MLFAQGAMVVAALSYLGAAVQRRFGQPVGAIFILTTALQFHLPFYASRTLPNTLALASTSMAHAEWLDGKRPYRTILLLAFTVVSNLTHQPLQPAQSCCRLQCFRPLLAVPRCYFSDHEQATMWAAGSTAVRSVAMGRPCGAAHGRHKADCFGAGDIGRAGSRSCEPAFEYLR